MVPGPGFFIVITEKRRFERTLLDVVLVWLLVKFICSSVEARDARNTRLSFRRLTAPMYRAGRFYAANNMFSASWRTYNYQEVLFSSLLASKQRALGSELASSPRLPLSSQVFLSLRVGNRSPKHFLLRQP